MDGDDSRQNEAMMAARARMYAPLVWDTTPDFEIQSLHDMRYDEAINLIKVCCPDRISICADIMIVS